MRDVPVKVLEAITSIMLPVNVEVDYRLTNSLCVVLNKIVTVTFSITHGVYRCTSTTEYSTSLERTFASNKQTHEEKFNDTLKFIRELCTDLMAYPGTKMNCLEYDFLQSVVATNHDVAYVDKFVRKFGYDSLRGFYLVMRSLYEKNIIKNLTVKGHLDIKTRGEIEFIFETRYALGYSSFSELFNTWKAVGLHGANLSILRRTDIGARIHMTFGDF